MNKIVFSEKYNDYRSTVLEILNSFHQEKGINVGDGDRNTIKAFQIEDFWINVKSFKVPNFINKWVYRYFRKSKAARSFQNAIKLQSLGIGTPAPIAYVEYLKGPFFDKSFYVSEQINADFSFRELIHNPLVNRREEIIRKFTQFTFKLHENGILFKDHSPGNTLIKIEGENIYFYLVDLNRMEFKELTFEERIYNFCRLTPLRDMVEIMSEEYAKLTDNSVDDVFKIMWKATQRFQFKFHRKRRLKKRVLFWRK